MWYKIPHTPTAMKRTADSYDQPFERPRTLDELRACIGVSGMIMYASRSWTSILGWSRADLAEGAFVERIHPDDMDEVVNAIHQIYQSGASANFACRYARKDGSYALIAWEALPRRDVQYINLRGVLAGAG